MTVKKLLLAASLLLWGLASAQDIPELLPDNTILALGMQDLSAQEAKFQPFVDEFERLELGQALAVLFNEGDEDMFGDMTGGDMTGGDATGGDMTGGMMDEDLFSGRLEGLTVYDFLGQDAWINLSASSFNPIPAVTLITRLSDEAASAVQGELDDHQTIQTLTGEDVETLTEGDYTFYQERVEDADPIQVVAYALADNLLMLSTNPDTLRGVLRQLGGSEDPSFVDSEGYANTLGRLESGTLYAYIDYAQIADAVAPLASNFGFDALVNRLSQALTTAGVAGSTIRVTDAGLVQEGYQVPNAEGGDTTLYNLLTNADPTTQDALSFVPEDALAYSSATVNLQGWWDYLNELAASVPELGGDLNTLLLSFFGVDLRTTFFDWTGSQVTSVTTGVSEMVQPGVAAENLLGESVFIIPTTDEEAARTGLQTLFQNLTQAVSAFADPQGGTGGAVMDAEDVDGISVTRYDLTNGVSLSYAVTDGQVLIATSAEAMQAVLDARANNASITSSNAYNTLQEVAPEGASSVALTDQRSTLESVAQQVAGQLEMTAGLTGAQNLDFDAVSDASSKLEEFITFIADKFGTSAGYGERGETLHSYSQTDVSW